MEPRDFQLPPDESPKTAERIPTFAELNAKFASIEVPDDELRSAAEIAWLHGDVLGDQ